MDDRSLEPPPAADAPQTQRTADDAAPDHDPAAVQTLKEAMRRVRVDNAERAAVLTDLHAARIGRLEILRDALKPLIAQIPKDVDYFDIAIMPGSVPRLFVDMIGFVEMGRDARAYRFLQDTRHGRVKLAETADVEMMADAVTDYVARRLLERDKALAAESADAPSAQPTSGQTPTAVTPSPDSPAPAKAGRRTALRWAGIAFAFLIDLLGSIAFFSILAGLAWVLYNRMHGHV